jgi:hypothetical protein
MKQACARGREHPNRGFRLHPSSGQGSSSFRQLRGEPSQGHCGRAPKRFTSTHRRWGGKLYHQWVEIHAIAVTQLAECARWR